MASLPVERRAAPRRRLRDRVASGNTPSSPALRRRRELQNLLLLVDDDLRETALALGGVEHWLARVTALVQQADPRAGEVHALAVDEEVVARADALIENLAALRKRMADIACAMR